MIVFAASVMRQDEDTLYHYTLASPRKAYWIKLRKYRVNHMAMEDLHCLHFFSDKEGIDSWRQGEKKNYFPADEAVVWMQWSHISRLYSRLRLRRDMSYD